jgi:flagellar biogenesis protein FliO
MKSLKMEKPTEMNNKIAITQMTAFQIEDKIYEMFLLTGFIMAITLLIAFSVSQFVNAEEQLQQQKSVFNLSGQFMGAGDGNANLRAQ